MIALFSLNATNNTTAHNSSRASVYVRVPLIILALLAAVSCAGTFRRGHKPSSEQEPESCRGFEKPSAAVKAKQNPDWESAFLESAAEPYQMETNPSLADDSQYGPVYLPDPRMPEDVKDSIKYIRIDERRRTGKNVDRTSSVTIISLREDKPFTFDDPDVPILEEFYDRIKESKWFRVMPPETKDDPYIIRGFNKFGRIVYYNEWYEVLPSALTNESSKASKRRVKVPEFRMPEEVSVE